MRQDPLFFTLSMDNPRHIPLSTLFMEFPLNVLAGIPDETIITGIALDNRAVLPGHLFVAMKGGSADGHDYIRDAIRRGAAAVAGDRQIEGLPVPYIQVDNSLPGAHLAGGSVLWQSRS